VSELAVEVVCPNCGESSTAPATVTVNPADVVPRVVTVPDMSAVDHKCPAKASE
jgi:hypothetical protein